MAAVFAKEEAKSKLKAYRLGQRTRNASFVSKIFNKDKPTFKEIKDQVQHNLLRNHSQKFQSEMSKKLNKLGYISKHDYKDK